MIRNYYTYCENPNCPEYKLHKGCDLKTVNNITYFPMMKCTVCDYILAPRPDEENSDLRITEYPVLTFPELWPKPDPLEVQVNGRSTGEWCCPRCDDLFSSYAIYMNHILFCDPFRDKLKSSFMKRILNMIRR